MERFENSFSASVLMSTMGYISKYYYGYIKGFTKEVINYSKDGKPYWISIEAQPILNEDGEVVQFRSPQEASRHGVGMVYQHFRLVDSFTVAQNIVLGMPKDQRPRSMRQIGAQVEALAEDGVKTLEDFASHRLISQNASSAQVSAGAILVRELMAYTIGSRLTVNNYFGVLQAVIHDLGIGILPDYLTQDFPDLVRVLPDVQSAEVPVFLAYPEELRQSKRVEVFRDFVAEEVIAYRRRQKEEAAVAAI